MSVVRKTAVFIILLGCGFALMAAKRSILPPYQIFRTKNNVDVYYFANAGTPLFEIKLAFGAGSDDDPAAQSGLAMFSAMMSRRGTALLDEEALAGKMDDLAAGLDVSVDEERVIMSAYGLNEHASEIIDLMFQQIAHPSFPEKPFLRLKANHLDDISQLPDNPAALASHVLGLMIFNGTKKARPGMGFKKDVERLRLVDAKDFYPMLTRTDRLKALVIGGKDKEEIADKVIRRIESLPCSYCGKPALASQKSWEFKSWRTRPGQILLLARPGISEAHLAMGFAGPPRRIPEFYDLQVAETVLAGNFGSRLNMVVREKLNLTYNIAAGFEMDEDTGVFALTTSTRQEKIGELLAAVNRLLSEFALGDVSETELQSAKDYLSGSFPLSLQNVYAIANAFFSGLLYGLEPSSLDSFQDGIARVTRDSVKSALKKYFHLAEMKTVIAGDPAILSKKLRSAKQDFVIRQPQTYL